MIGQVRDVFRQSTGQVYNDLSYIIEGGSDMDERKRQNIARGAGVIMATIGLLPIGVIAKKVPWIGRIISPRKFAKYVLKAEGSRIRRLAITLGSSGLAEALEEGSQEAVQILSEEMGQSYQEGGDGDLVAAMERASANWQANLERIGKAGVIGGIAGSAFRGAVEGIGKADTGAAVDQEVDNVPPLPPGAAPVSDLPNIPPAVRGTKAVNLALVLRQASQLTKETATKNLLPDDINQIRRQMFEDAGVPNVWVDKEDIEAWSGGDETKISKALSIIDSTGIIQSEVDAPIRISAEQFLTIVDEDPEFADIAKADPHGLSMREFGKRMKEAQDKRGDLMQEAPVDNEQVRLNYFLNSLDTSGVRITNEQAIQALPILKELVELEQLTGEPTELQKRRERKLKLDLKTIGDGKNYKASTLLSAYKESVRRVEGQGKGTELRIEDEDIMGMDEYLAQPTFTEDMYDVISKDEALKYNEAQMTTRAEVVDALEAEVNKEIDKVQNLYVEIQTELDRMIQESEFESTPEIETVENFLNNEVEIGELNEFQQMRKEKGLPIYAIDQRTLPDNLKPYLTNAKLKKRKVFNQKGIPLKEALVLFGYRDAETFLKVLADTPTREEKIDANVAIREKEIRAESTVIRDLEESRFAKAYNNMTRNHIKEMKLMLSKRWSATKRGIKRIALPLPKLKTLQRRAKEVIGTTKVRDLNANQYKVGERKSQRKAVNSILKNEVEKAFNHKHNAAYNTQLAKESHIAIGKVNRAFSYIARLNTPRVQAELQEAGQYYLDAVNYILDLYNFDMNKKGQGKVEQYQKFVEKMLEQGRGDFEIPIEVQEWLSTKASPSSMTVDQVMYITNKIRAIHHQAKLKNKLYRDFEANQQNATMEIVADKAREEAENHPDYNPEKLKDPQGVVPVWTKFKNFMLSAETTFKNSLFITQELDAGKVGGFWNQLIHQPIQGTGIHQGPYGYVAQNKLLGKYQKKFKEIVKKYYGKVEFNNYGAVSVKVPEFENLPGLGDGKGTVTKLELLTLLMNMGNIENKSRISNFGIDPDLVFKVLTRELSQKDFDFVQEGVWGIFDTLKSRIQAVHKTTTGNDVEFVIPEPFEAFGKTYQGGYYPIRYKSDINTFNLMETVQNDIEAFKPGDKAIDKPYDAYEGIVRSPHTKERTGSEHELNLDINVFNNSLTEVLHDVTMRVPIRDVMTLLKDKDIRESIISVVGKQKYDALVNMVAHQTNSAAVNSQRIYQAQQNTMSKIYTSIEGAFAVNYILFNVNSFLMSALAIPQIVNKMGTNGEKHLVRAAMKVLNPINWRYQKQAMDFVAEIDPSLTLFREGIDDYNAKALAHALPKRRLFTNRPYNMAKTAQERAIEFGFGGILGGVDSAMKMTTVIAAYNQYIAGDAPGYSYDTVHKGKTEQQIHEEAKAYASALVESTTMRAGQFDKAIVQNLTLGRPITKFWNEMRNALNNRIQDVRNIRYNAKRAVKLQKEGDTLGAAIAMDDIGAKGARMILTSMLGMAIINAVRGNNPFPLEDGDEDDEKTIDQMLADMPRWMIDKVTTAEGLGDLGVEMFGQNVPVLRDMIFSGRDLQTGRQVSVPIFSALTDITTTGAVGIRSMIDIYQDELTLMEVADELDPKELRAVLNTIGYSSGGIPISGMYKILEALDTDDDGEIDGEFINMNFIKNLDQFIADNDESFTEEEIFAAMVKQAEGKELTDQEKRALEYQEDPNKKDTLGQAVDQMKEVRNALAPLPKGEVLTDGAYEIIKYAESGGRWNAGAGTSSAFGLYQFTEGTWKRVMNTPEGRAAGLTMNGRLSRRSSQQEKAMRILTKYNVAQMRRDGVPINIETVYFAHHFSPQYASEVYNGNNSDKLSKNLLSNSVLKANPQLRKQNVKTAGGMKKYIREALMRGQRALQESSY